MTGDRRERDRDDGTIIDWKASIASLLIRLRDMARHSPLPVCFDTRLVFPYLFHQKPPVQNECSTCVFLAATQTLRARYCIDQDEHAFPWYHQWKECDMDDTAFAGAVHDHVTRVYADPHQQLFHVKIVPAWDSFTCSNTDDVHQTACITSFDCHGKGIVPEELLDIMKDRPTPCHQPPSTISSLGRIRSEHWFSGSWKVQPNPLSKLPFHDILRARHKIKRSILDHGPLMATIRIDRKTFYDPTRWQEQPPRAYTLPESGVYDEYHQVLVVGFTWAPSSLRPSRIVPCWIIQDWRDVGDIPHTVANEYIAEHVPPFLQDAVQHWARLAKHVRVRGCFLRVEMATRANTEADRCVCLEENAYAFQAYDA